MKTRHGQINKYSLKSLPRAEKYFTAQKGSLSFLTTPDTTELTHVRPQDAQPARSDAKVKVKVTQLCPTLCNPMDCSLPGSSVLEILQAIILEWVAVPFSRGSS